MPGEGDVGEAAVEEHRLAGQGRDELAQLGARELDQRGGLGFDAEALQDGQRRQQVRRRRGRQVEFDPHGDRVARDGGLEIRREQQAEHEDEIPTAQPPKAKEIPAPRQTAC